MDINSEPLLAPVKANNLGRFIMNLMSQPRRFWKRKHISGFGNVFVFGAIRHTHPVNLKV